MDIDKVVYVAILFIITIILHELTHWLALKKMGATGRLAVMRKNFFPTIGIRYTGGLKNWRQVLYFKSAPIPITFVCLFHLSFVLIDPSGLFDILGWFVVWVFALGLTFCACSADYFDIRLIILKGSELNFEHCFKPEEKK